MSHQSPAIPGQTSVTGKRASVWREFLSGAGAMLPLLVGALPFGLVFGALAVSAGLSASATLAMSVFVFAGSAQFIAAGLVATGTGLWLIVLTTLVVNLRHMLYGATLAPHVWNLSHRWQVLLAYLTTDETYAVSILRYQSGDDSPHRHWYFLGTALTLLSGWVTFTGVGIVAGQAIPDPLSWGLDFALPIIFVGLLIPHARGRPALVAILVAGSTSVLAHRLPNNLWLLLAAVAGVVAGVGAESVWPPADPEGAKE